MRFPAPKSIGARLPRRLQSTPTHRPQSQSLQTHPHLIRDSYRKSFDIHLPTQRLNAQCAPQWQAHVVMGRYKGIGMPKAKKKKVMQSPALESN